MELQHKKVVVAGGTSGIGLAAALLFHQAGASVTVTGRDPGKLKAARSKGLGAVRADSRDPAEMEGFFRSGGSLDHLVIALGSSKGVGNFADLRLEDIREGFEEKYFPQLTTLKAALPCLKKRGTVTLVTAITASAKMPGTSGIGSVNGALEIFVPILAKELKPLRINAVSPGVVDTPWWDFLPQDAKRQTFEEFSSQIAVGRVAQPDDIAKTILFLTQNPYMTGKIIACDGGLA
jgi:NAD(P)-dependent dehydrogenase (short-subunit alcohol dehydrogenase family)